MNTMHHVQDWENRKVRRCVRISSDMVDGFAALSGDASPIHMSDDAAQRHSFQRRVVHGMLLGSLVSGTLGMELPGERGVLEKMQLSFRNPCYVDDEITIDVAVAKFFASVQTLVLTVKITRADGTLLARGTAQAGLR